MFDPTVVYCYSFSARMLDKMVDLCYKKLHAIGSVSEPISKRRREGD